MFIRPPIQNCTNGLKRQLGCAVIGEQTVLLCFHVRQLRIAVATHQRAGAHRIKQFPELSCERGTKSASQ